MIDIFLLLHLAVTMNHSFLGNPEHESKSPTIAMPSHGAVACALHRRALTWIRSWPGTRRVLCYFILLPGGLQSRAIFLASCRDYVCTVSLQLPGVTVFLCRCREVGQSHS